MGLVRNGKLDQTFIEMKPIWLFDEDSNHLMEGRFVVTNERKLIQVVEELRDIDTYVYTANYNRSGSSTEYVEYNSFGAVRHREGKSWHIEDTYLNPRAEVYQLITGDDRSTNNLLDLFATIESGSNMATCEQGFYRAQELIYQLQNSSLDSATIRKIIKGMWPNFGYYAVECLDCTEIQPVQCYDIGELRYRVEQGMDINMGEKGEGILSKQYEGGKNSKVLALAKKAYKISR